MARKKKSELEAEAKAAAEDTLPSAVAPEDDPDVTVVDETNGIELVDPAPKVEPAAKPAKPERPTAEEAAAAAPKRYVVVRGGRIMHRGALTILRTGKTIKETDYNVPQLLEQGVALDEIKD